MRKVVAVIVAVSIGVLVTTLAARQQGAQRFDRSAVQSIGE